MTNLIMNELSLNRFSFQQIKYKPVKLTNSLEVLKNVLLFLRSSGRRNSFPNFTFSKNFLLNKNQINIVLNETEVLVIFNSIDEVLTRETDSKTLEGFNNSLDFCDIK